jgi:hypothetical protein
MIDENAGKVVRVTNIADFDFTPEMGAMYDGRPFPLRKGESGLYPYVIGEHLARHLARQIKLHAAPVRDEKELDGRGKDAPLWSLADENLLTQAIMSDAYTQTSDTQPKSAADLLIDQANALNNQGPTTYKDKAEVIKELTRRNISFNPRDTKANLEKLLG